MKCSQITVPGVNLCFHKYIQQGDLIVCLHVLVVRTNLEFQFENKLFVRGQLKYSGKMQQ